DVNGQGAAGSDFGINHDFQRRGASGLVNYVVGQFDIPIHGIVGAGLQYDALQTGDIAQVGGGDIGLSLHDKSIADRVGIGAVVVKAQGHAAIERSLISDHDIADGAAFKGEGATVDNSQRNIGDIDDLVTLFLEAEEHKIVVVPGVIAFVGLVVTGNQLIVFGLGIAFELVGEVGEVNELHAAGAVGQIFGQTALVGIITSAVVDAIFPVFNDLVPRSEEHTSELQSRESLVCRLLLEKKK